jgi:hypothetical protein
VTPAEELDEIRRKLRVASQLRVPVFDRKREPRYSLRSLAEEMAEYMLLSAFQAGELHEARLGLRADLEELLREWEQLAGWEMYRSGKTDSSREEAKKQAEPELWANIAAVKWLINQRTDEMDRLNRDAETVVSRAYTILTGT